MELNVQDWKEFNIPRLFDICAGNYYSSDDYEYGTTPYVSASAVNNGVGQMINLPPDFQGNKIVTGKVECKAFYQGDPFSATSDANIFAPKFEMTQNVGLFLTSIITFNENGKWSYGRQCRVGDSKEIVVKLPIQHNEDNTPVIDENRVYSDEGYIPDWQFMEDYIKSLHHKPITTKVKAGNAKELNIASWEEFYLKDLFHCQMGNGIDAGNTTNDNPKYNYVSRDSKGNGVVAQVDEYFNISKNGIATIEEPFKAGTMTLALGGSFLGSCFVQKHPYYTAQNVAVLTEKEPLSIATKLFISTLIRNECKYKYLAFGRELNTHYKTDFIIKLPIKMDCNGNPVIDGSHKYSDKGFIPDWQFMEDYINSLPYSDRI